ncbi:hypothetical protein EDF56_101947 [Novosphingobium sp. PhB165]|uniref:hypothetical protein n=1 Tax=Novosphingobium sp. PhB165 TaxID=2485105 RepID=UPI001044888E|nr:hypothetical protein [Novosphingobium sp. PhB165]TCM22261.1 hypothetical protein EDF56_101947 [Novosphingobium sp. PhB165]
MTIRFSAARGGMTPVIKRMRCAWAPLDAANDNDPKRRGTFASGPLLPSAANQNGHDQRMLTEALRHFAVYGLSAARHARANAEEARLHGDEKACNWWVAICRQLDRRMAEALARKIANGA